MTESLLLTQDETGNTAMHYAYQKNQPHLRKSIREYAGAVISAKIK